MDALARSRNSRLPRIPARVIVPRPFDLDLDAGAPELWRHAGDNAPCPRQRQRWALLACMFLVLVLVALSGKPRDVGRAQHLPPCRLCKLTTRAPSSPCHPPRKGGGQDRASASDGPDPRAPILGGIRAIARRAVDNIAVREKGLRTAMMMRPYRPPATSQTDGGMEGSMLR